jgi:3-phenylpropionate/trans-cinnamate dioxygenase ferredoxin component
MAGWIKVARLEQLQDGKTFPITADDQDIVLIRQGAQVYALLDNCSHQDFPLSQGQVLPGAKLKCRAHGAEFCLKTGKALCAPAFAPVEAFPVKVEDGEVFLDLG